MRKLGPIAQVAVTLACGWIVWVNTVNPRLRGDSLGLILTEAMLYVLIAWLFSAVAALCAYLAVFLTEPADDFGESLRLSIRSTAPAMWLAPALILMAALSPLPVFAGLILLINVTGLLVLRWMRMSPSGGVPAGPLFQSSLPSLGAALALQLGCMSLWLGHRLPAAVLFFSSVALLTARSIVAGAYELKKEPVLPPSFLGLVVTFVLALALTAAGITARDGDDAGAGVPQQNVTRLYSPADAKAGQGGFPGVILRSRQKPKQELILPAALVSLRQEAGFTHPLRIPFTGEYWMYRKSLAPLMQLPGNSLVQWGSPLELSFHTADFRPLRMEAHQRLNPAIDLSCCSSIAVVVSSAPGPESVRLLADLVVIDASRKPLMGRENYLGTVPIGGGPSETLTFAVPAFLRSRACDELEAVFHPELNTGVSMARSSRVQIMEIVLTP